MKTVLFADFAWTGFFRETESKNHRIKTSIKMRNQVIWEKESQVELRGSVFTLTFYLTECQSSHL